MRGEKMYFQEMIQDLKVTGKSWLCYFAAT